MPHKTLEELTNELEEIQRQKRERKRLESRLNNVRQELSNLRSRRSRYEDTLQREKEDVEELKGMSLTSFYYSIVGDKVRELEKREKELARAKNAYEEVTDAIADLKKEKERYERDLEELRHLEDRYEQTLETKEELLLELDHPKSDRLRRLSREIGRLRNKITELDDAIHAGSQVSTHLAKISSNVRSARSSGRYEMLTDNWYMTMKKRGKLRQARRLNRQTTFYTRSYRRELEDLKETEFSLPGRVSISGTSAFLDYFMDGLGDYFAQRSINKSLDQIRMSKQKITRQLSTLKDQKNKLQEMIRDKENEREELIRSS